MNHARLIIILPHESQNLIVRRFIKVINVITGMKTIKPIRGIPVTSIEKAKRTLIEIAYQGKYFFLNATFLPRKNIIEPAIPRAMKSPMITTKTISLISILAQF